jgi:RecA-family ATPase
MTSQQISPLDEATSSGASAKIELPATLSKHSDTVQPHEESSIEAIKQMVNDRLLDYAESSNKEKETHSLFRLSPEECTAAHLLNEDVSLDFLFPNFGVRKTASLLCAPPGTGKTWMVIQLAASLATGKTLLGSNFIPQAKGKTILFLAEEIRAVIRKRIMALCKHFSKVDEQIMLNSLIIPDIHTEQTALLSKTGTSIKVTDVADAMITFIKKCEGLVCIIFDTMNFFHNTDLEANPEAVQSFIKII